jgi:hypothetical protein
MPPSDPDIWVSKPLTSMSDPFKENNKTATKGRQ